MTVAELGRRMSSAEFAEWVGYYEIEPFGDLRADYRAGIVASLIFNSNRVETAEPIGPDYFFRPPAPASPDLLNQKVRTFFSAAEGRDFKPKTVH